MILRDVAQITSGHVAVPPAVADGDWMLHRACVGVDPAVFFPVVGENAALAKSICASCPVAPECLAYALANREQFGIWGGLSPKERKRLPRGRRRPQHAVCGTTGGYAAHRRRGEPTCEPCRDANAMYARDYSARVAVRLFASWPP